MTNSANISRFVILKQSWESVKPSAECVCQTMSLRKMLTVLSLSPSTRSWEVRRSAAKRLSLVRLPSIPWLVRVKGRRLELGETWSVEIELLRRWLRFVKGWFRALWIPSFCGLWWPYRTLAWHNEELDLGMIWIYGELRNSVIWLRGCRDRKLRRLLCWYGILFLDDAERFATSSAIIFRYLIAEFRTYFWFRFGIEKHRPDFQLCELHQDFRVLRKLIWVPAVDYVFMPRSSDIVQ